MISWLGGREDEDCGVRRALGIPPHKEGRNMISYWCVRTVGHTTSILVPYISGLTIQQATRRLHVLVDVSYCSKI